MITEARTRALEYLGSADILATAAFELRELASSALDRDH
jgi:hypothetical protein